MNNMRKKKLESAQYGTFKVTFIGHQLSTNQHQIVIIIIIIFFKLAG